MTVLQRTDLTTSQKIECAAAAVARQHEHGSKTALSETYEISRPTVYAIGARAHSVLRAHFEAPLLGGAGVTVRVDDAQLRRAVVALRVLAPNAIRPIEDLLPVLYPGVKVSYGTIQAMLVEAEARAGRLNAQAPLVGIEAGALDEMFSQGEPVLAGMDLDSGYLFGLSLSPTRDAAAWAQVLRAGQGQGLSLSVVVKDAARGIAAGVGEVFPDAEQRDDCFHVFYEMNKVRGRLERRAYEDSSERSSDQVGGGEPGWQQRFNVGQRLRPGQLGEHPAQVGVGFESVRLRALDERVQPGAGPGAGHGIGEQPAPTPEAKWADGIFDRVMPISA